MAITELVQPLFRRWRSARRYHTIESQTLALVCPTIIGLFLLSGWRIDIVTLTPLAMVEIGFSFFVQSRMVVECPSRRLVRYILRLGEILLGMAIAILIVFLAGSFTNMAVLYVVYVITAVLTSEVHGRRILQFG